MLAIIMKIPKMENIVYRQMPTPRELAGPRGKSLDVKAPGWGANVWYKFPGCAGGIVTAKIHSCIRDTEMIRCTFGDTNVFFIFQNLTETGAVNGCTFDCIRHAVFRMFSCLQINWQPFYLRQLLKFHPFDWLIISCGNIEKAKQIISDLFFFGAKGIILHFGVNDIEDESIPSDDVAYKISEAANQTKAKFPMSEIFISEITPRMGRHHASVTEVNAYVNDLVLRDRCSHHLIMKIKIRENSMLMQNILARKGVQGNQSGI